MPFDQAKVHSACRWGKTKEEVSALLGGDAAAAANCRDPKNGNQPLHIAAQNGHLELVKFLVSQKADVNGQNGTGATPLHMSVGYDYYDCTRELLRAGADVSVKNEAEHTAGSGLEGDHKGVCAWDGPFHMLKQATDAASASAALKGFEDASQSDLSMCDKAELIKMGMGKAKEIPGWDKARFMAIAKKV